jgi:hypothetical protein
MIISEYNKGISFNLWEDEELNFEMKIGVPNYAPLGSYIELKISNGITQYTVNTQTKYLRQFAETLLSLVKEHGLPEDFKDDKLAKISEE